MKRTDRADSQRRYNWKVAVAVAVKPTEMMETFEMIQVIYKPTSSPIESISWIRKSHFVAQWVEMMDYAQL